MVTIFTLNISAEIATVSIVKNARGHAMRAALIALMLMLGSQVGFSYRKLGTKCETKNVEMETLNRNKIDYTLYRRLLINLNINGISRLRGV